jgi:hypothetical protein
VTRAAILILMAVATLAALAEPLPIPFTGGNCQFGYYWTGSYCVPSGAPGAGAKPPGGSCPNGWLASGNACIRSGVAGGSDPQSALPIQNRRNARPQSTMSIQNRQKRAPSIGSPDSKPAISNKSRQIK